MSGPPAFPILSLRAVTRRWRVGILGSRVEETALDACSLEVQAGEVVAVTGGAGAGKSTLLLVATGQVAPSGGTVRWAGVDDAAAVRPQLVGARPWEYNFLTVRQALVFHADVLALRTADAPRRTRFVPLMAAVGLRGRSRARLGELSAIDRLRVVVAQALLAEPRLVCCEEPLAFCGPEERRAGAALLRRVAARGIAVLVATREEATIASLDVADRIVRLERGRLVPPRAPSRSVLELSVRSPEDAMLRLASRLPSLARRGRRLRVSLGGTTPESVLALFRDAGVRVRASRVAEERVTAEGETEERATGAHAAPDGRALRGASSPLPGHETRP
ncbi:MAG: ATP-binding cassette domain-containing protein [Gemmatimonadota bacterium]|nr:ATP-binding cassette domain-containing protein [Gemmatimonadota bacterium]